MFYIDEYLFFDVRNHIKMFVLFYQLEEKKKSRYKNNCIRFDYFTHLINIEKSIMYICKSHMIMTPGTRTSTTTITKIDRFDRPISSAHYPTTSESFNLFSIIISIFRHLKYEKI